MPASRPAKPAPALFGRLRRVYGSCPLTDLSPDVLALVADALALVRLRRANLADLGRGLADDLLVDAADDDLRRHRHLEGDPLARRDAHGMREPDLEL